MLALLDISRALVSIDATGCQKDIADQIVAQKGDYLLAVRDNPPRLFEDLRRLADGALAQGFAGLSTHRQEGTADGRQEMRFCFVIENPGSGRDGALWHQLRSLVVVVSGRVVAGTASDEVRYDISSRKATAQSSRRRCGPSGPSRTRVMGSWMSRSEKTTTGCARGTHRRTCPWCGRWRWPC